MISYVRDSCEEAQSRGTSVRQRWEVPVVKEELPGTSEKVIDFWRKIRPNERKDFRPTEQTICVNAKSCEEAVPGDLQLSLRL